VRRAVSVICATVCVLSAPVTGAAQQREGLREWLHQIDTGLEQVVKLTGTGDVEGARVRALRVYLDHYETIEGWYGAGGRYEVVSITPDIGRAEQAFHVLIRSTSASEIESTARSLREQLKTIERAALQGGAVLYPNVPQPVESAGTRTDRVLRTSEIERVSNEMAAAEAALVRGDRAEALRKVEAAYLEGFEPLESRLPGPLVAGIERVIHLQLRPALKGSATSEQLASMFGDLQHRLGQADQFLVGGGSFWFGVFNSFVIIVREGLEAVLLLGALLAYLNAARTGTRERRRIWAGAVSGIVASLATWIVAITLVPLGGASREMVEGVTALLAVAVLLYVSHWLFQKTYTHDWKTYLRDHLGSAVSRGSALAMMGLAFAAVYREGFETVLFYQALLLDAGGKAVLTGFLPGLLVISAIGWAIIRAGMKLPLKQVFAVTNTILLYLAFVFLGKGIYNLQESGAFAAHPLGWLPSHPALEQIFGFYPLAETVVAQGALGTLLAVALIVYRRQMLRARRVSASREEALAA
jgi:FTR1 family protein